MKAWQSPVQLLQLHVEELDAAAGKQPAASRPAVLATTLRTNLDELMEAQQSRKVVEQMLQAEVRMHITRPEAVAAFN